MKLNGKVQKLKNVAGWYISFSQKWKVNDIIEVEFLMELSFKSTNDNPDKVAIMYDPIVLAGKIGTAQINSHAPYSDPSVYNDYYPYQYHVPADIITSLHLNPQNITSTIEKTPNE